MANSCNGTSPLLDSVIRKSIALQLPFNAHFDLTYRCNERCIHCYLDHEDYGELTTEEVKAILDQLARAGTLFLTFSGGEVFLRRDFFELAAYARTLHFDLSIKTNGLLVTRERAERLAALPVRRVQISIYSADPDVHDAITKVPGSLERSLHAIRFLQSCGLPVKIACPLMKDNVAGFPALRRLAEALGVPYVIDLTITPKLDGSQDPLRLRVDANQLLPILRDRSLNPGGNGAQKGFAESLPPRPAGATPPPAPSANPIAEIPCSAGHNSFYISPYGDLFPCVQMTLPTGNLRRQSFEEIWYGSDRMRKVRSVRTNELPICSTCEIRRYCARCPGQALAELDDLEAPSPRACEIAEANARLAGVEQPISAWRRTHNLVAAAPASASLV